MQAERIQEQRRRRDSLVAWRMKKVEITVDRVLRARGKMEKNKANGPGDCLVTEMLRELHFQWSLCTKSHTSLKTDSEENAACRKSYVWYFSRSLMRQ